MLSHESLIIITEDSIISKKAYIPLTLGWLGECSISGKVEGAFSPWTINPPGFKIPTWPPKTTNI